MATKYIVNNVPGQTINGDITINGNLTVTGVTTGNLATYKALLTQTPPLTGTEILDFDNKLIIGESYEIITYQDGDDFSNIADVISGTINEDGCIFMATGFTPTVWSNGTTLLSAGDFVVTELENTLGFDVSWSEPLDGVYFAQNNDGLSENTFPRELTQTFINQNGGLSVINPNLLFQSQVVTDTEIDDSVLLTVFDFGPGDYVSGELYYTTVEINILHTLPS